jgi:hypothetical protein
VTTEAAEPTLSGFLLARVTEDEATARRLLVTAQRVSLTLADPKWLGLPAPGWYAWPEIETSCARAIADCEAKRRILERHAQKTGANLPRHPICAECGGADWRPEDGVLQPFPWVMPWPCHTLRALAVPYADHPDCRDEWRQ